MNRIPLAFALALLVAGCATVAPDGTRMTAAPTTDALAATASAVDPGAAAVDGQAIRCIDELVTGSRVPQRVCRTEADWQRITEASQNYTREIQGPLVKAPGD